MFMKEMKKPGLFLVDLQVYVIIHDPRLIRPVRVFVFLINEILSVHIYLRSNNKNKKLSNADGYI